VLPAVNLSIRTDAFTHDPSDVRYLIL